MTDGLLIIEIYHILIVKTDACGANKLMRCANCARPIYKSLKLHIYCLHNICHRFKLIKITVKIESSLSLSLLSRANVMALDAARKSQESRGVELKTRLMLFNAIYID